RDSQSSVTSNTSSISSLVSSPISPRFMFKTFSKFIPLSWGARVSTSPALPAPVEPMTFGKDKEVVPSPTLPLPGKFVSREKQLRKLKTRMEVEGVMAMKASVNIKFRKCHGREVCLRG
ncbi:hypothetical protein CPC08DRAFT_709084, partial [Agrocybe pediades]